MSSPFHSKATSPFLKPHPSPEMLAQAVERSEEKRSASSVETKVALAPMALPPTTSQQPSAHPTTPKAVPRALLTAKSVSRLSALSPSFVPRSVPRSEQEHKSPGLRTKITRSPMRDATRDAPKARATGKPPRPPNKKLVGAAPPSLCQLEELSTTLHSHDCSLVAAVVNLFARVLSLTGRQRDAIKAVNLGIKALKRVKDDEGHAMTQLTLGCIYGQVSDSQEATQRSMKAFQNALSLFRKLENHHGMGSALWEMGMAGRTPNFTDATKRWEEALHHFELGSTAGPQPQVTSLWVAELCDDADGRPAAAP